MGADYLFYFIGADGADIQVCACVYHTVDGGEVHGAENRWPRDDTAPQMGTIGGDVGAPACGSDGQ